MQLLVCVLCLKEVRHLKKEILQNCNIKKHAEERPAETAGRRGQSCREATCREVAGEVGTGGWRRAGRSGAPPGAGACGAEPRLSHGLTQRHQTAGTGPGAPRLPRRLQSGRQHGGFARTGFLLFCVVHAGSGNAA